MKNSVITIGTFDGVHKGHQVILNKVVEVAEKENLKSIVLSKSMEDVYYYSEMPMEELAKDRSIEFVAYNDDLSFINPYKEQANST